jgi:DNA-binding NarL/FixJ family response regulator
MSENGALSVLLVDNHRLFREGLRDLLSEQGIEIVGEAADAGEAVSPNSTCPAPPTARLTRCGA